MAEIDKQLAVIERDIDRRVRLVEDLRLMDQRGHNLTSELVIEEADLIEIRKTRETLVRVRVMAPYLAEPE